LHIFVFFEPYVRSPFSPPVHREDSSCRTGRGEQIVVLPGDTLWNIAEEHAPRGSNIRQYIQKLKRVNGLDGSSIQAGQILILP